ncbi:CTD kinase subunit beta, partial [Tremellales sp. Uapishka_1]
MTASSGEASSSRIKHHKPYFTPVEVERLSSKQRGKLSVSREERGRQQACGFIDAVGTRCGFPRRTMATAQSLYMRFHLFFPYKEFNHVEVALSTLYVSSKLHDTLKKPRDIIAASYIVRFPNLVKKGTIAPEAINPQMAEHDRSKVLMIERLVLETMCFNFKVEVGFPMVVKLAKKLGLKKDVGLSGWKVVVDW